MQQDVPQYGVEDTSFQAAGGQEGVFQLVDEFYQQMDTLVEAQTIRAMHPEDMSSSADKLACFLCGWLGGPKLYREKYGSIHIPQAHKPFDIGCDERDAWLLCMRKALEKQPYAETFKTYLLEQLWRPAERSRTRD